MVTGVRGRWCGRKGIMEAEGKMVRKKHREGGALDTGIH